MRLLLGMFIMLISLSAVLYSVHQTLYGWIVATFASGVAGAFISEWYRRRNLPVTEDTVERKAVQRNFTTINPMSLTDLKKRLAVEAPHLSDDDFWLSRGVFITWKTPETDNEYRERQERATAQQERHNNWERTMYDKLREKYSEEERHSDLEELAAKFHDIYQEVAHRHGDIRHSDNYYELSDEIKEYDRALARWVLSHFKEA